MKLKKLLKLIPDEYKIGLTDYEGMSRLFRMEQKKMPL